MDTRFLTGVRGIAALLVVISHGANHGYAPARLFGYGLGQYGVAIFFCLSGYLMGMLYAHRDPSAHWRRYAIARIARVLPLFYAVLLVSAAMSAAVGTFPIKVRPEDFPLNLFLLHGSSILWTIPVEVQFYVVFVGLWALSAKLGRRFWLWTAALSAALAAVVIQAWTPEVGVSSILLCWQYFFIFGTACGVYGANGGAERYGALHARARGALTPLCLALVALSIPGVRRVLDLPVYETWTDPYIMAGTVALFALAFGEPVVQRVLSTRPLTFLGDISYSLYLTHMVGVWFVRTAFQKLGLPYEWVGLAPLLLLCILMAAASTWWFERPVQTLILRWWQRRG
ncbi:acyltransferase family protein [Rhodovulum sp. DZ06]|uniref:acyltransferase family protein n=1 Tax=Rhodovulum sp. DZ06 TaxID=3425126 RepID=UPI003D35106B